MAVTAMGVIAVPDEMTVPTMQSLLRAPGLGATRGRLSVGAGRERPAQSRTVDRFLGLVGHWIAVAHGANSRTSWRHRGGRS